MSPNDDYLYQTPDRSLNLLSRSPIHGSVEKSVIDKAVKVNYINTQLSRSWIWGSLNAVAFALICFDLSERCSTPWTTVQSIEFGLAVIFFLNIVYHICCYIHYFKTKIPVEATKSQLHLLGYPSNDSSFVLAPPQLDETGSKLNSSLNLTAFSYDRSRKNDSGFNTSINNANVSASHQSHRESPTNITLSPGLGNTSNSKTHKSPGFGKSAKVNTCIDFIRDEHSLDQYLKEYDAFEKHSKAVFPDKETSDVTPIWSHPSSSEPEPSKLINNQYQLAYTVTDDSSRNLAKDKTSPLMQYAYIDFWKKRDINPNHVARMVDDLRVWISSTILNRVADEINAANEHFMKHGHSELRIGYTCLERLRKSTTLHNGPPTLSTLLPFLSFSNNQEYVVHRIKELAKSRCMSDFRWNSGSLLFHGKAWDAHLPTDSAMIMHLLATYLDGQLVPLPQQPDGKPFTSQYLCTNVSEKPVRLPGKFKIHQTEINPPNYVLVTENAIHEPAKGRNNLFHTLILFLQFIKTMHNGMLGRVSLGPAGINLLWVIEKK